MHAQEFTSWTMTHSMQYDTEEGWRGRMCLPLVSEWRNKLHQAQWSTRDGDDCCAQFAAFGKHIRNHQDHHLILLLYPLPFISYFCCWCFFLASPHLLYSFSIASTTIEHVFDGILIWWIHHKVSRMGKKKMSSKVKGKRRRRLMGEGVWLVGHVNHLLFSFPQLFDLASSLSR